MIEQNIKIKKKIRTNMWRKVALTAWNRPNEPVIYARVELDPTKAIEYLRVKNQTSKTKLTMTHYLGKVCGILLHLHEELNSTILYRNAYVREGSDIFFHVSLIDENGKENLSGVNVKDCAGKSIEQIAEEINRQGQLVKTGQDVTFNKIKNMMKLIPLSLTGLIVKLSSFIQNRLNIWSPILGTKKDTFGAMMITNIGSLGIREAFVPFSHYTNVNSILAIGNHFETPIVEDGEVKIGIRQYANWTLDHRVIDGSSAAKMLEDFKKYFEHPDNIEKFKI